MKPAAAKQVFRLKRDSKGLAAIEFALVAPLLVLLIMTGLELAHFAVAKLTITHMARIAADITGRYTPALSLSDVDDVISGVEKSGDSLDFSENGRIIISGLQQNAAKNGQWINWQRCAGAKAFTSSYGSDDAGFSNATVQGMGIAGSQIAAPAGIYVIFVEIAYDYQPLLASSFIGNPTIKSNQAFIVRGRQSGNIQGAYTLDSGSNYVRVNGTGARTATAQGAILDNCALYAP
jgi:Flp pilus assembly pilin Flp